MAQSYYPPKWSAGDRKATPNPGPSAAPGPADAPAPQLPLAVAAWQPSRKVHIAIVASLAVALSLIFIRLPVRADDCTPDWGAWMGYDIFARDNRQLGIDFIENVGPYGYLHFVQAYSGVQTGQKIFFGVTFGIVLALMCVRALRYFPGTAAKALFILALLWTPDAATEVMDTFFYLFYLLAAHHLMTRQRYRSHWLTDFVILFFIALIALFKGTTLTMVPLLVALVAAQSLWQRHWRRALSDVGTLVGSFLVLWLMAGQLLSTFPAYLRGIFAFIAAFSEAQINCVAHEWDMVLLSMVLLGLLAAVNVGRLLKFHRYAFRLPVTLFEAGLFAVVWKHGFVRADHAYHYWAFMIVAAPLFFLAHEGSPSAGPAAPQTHTHRMKQAARTLWSPQGRAWLATISALGLCVWGTCLATVYPRAELPFTWPAKRIAANVSGLVDWGDRRESLEHDLALNRAACALPQMRKIVGQDTVDQFGCMPGLALLNDVNFHPRPMTTSFVAVNNYLIDLNSEFYRNDATAPTYLMAYIDDPDQRFTPQQETRTMLEVLARYQPVLVEKGVLLLKRMTYGPITFHKTLVNTQTVGWKEPVMVPANAGPLVWCTVNIQWSALGKLRGMLYKWPMVYIVMGCDRGTTSVRRFLVTPGPLGFPINPLIINQADLLAAFGVNGGDVPGRTAPSDRFYFAVQDQDRRYVKDRIEVSFWSIDKQP